MDIKKIDISTTCHEIFDRPRISYKVREYFEELLLSRLPNDVVEDEWHYHWLIFFEPFGKYDSIQILPGDAYRTERIKSASALVSLPKNEGNPYPIGELVGLIRDSVSHLACHQFNGLSTEFMTEMMKDIDNDYLSSLPYPAQFDDQRYVQDNDPVAKSIYLEKFGT